MITLYVEYLSLRKESAFMLATSCSAANIMTTRLITLHPDMTCQDAVQVLLNNHISGSPVVDSLGELVGVISLKDLLRNSEYQLPSPMYYDELYLDDLMTEEAFDLVNLNTGTVAELMTLDVVTVVQTAPIETVAKVLYTQKVHRVIVVAEGGRPLGIVTTFDVLKAFAGDRDALKEPL